MFMYNICCWFNIVNIEEDNNDSSSVESFVECKV